MERARRSDDRKGKRKAQPAEEEEAAVLDDEEEQEAPRSKGPRGRNEATPGARGGETGGDSQRKERRTGAGTSRGEARAGGSRAADEGVPDCADVNVKELIAEAKASIEEAEKSLKHDVSDKDKIPLVREVMRFMLFRTSKTDEPAAKSDLTRCVSSIAKDKRGLPEVIIRMAQLKFLENFGMQMVEMSKKGKTLVPVKQQIKAAEKAEKIVFILRSVLPARIRQQHVDTSAALPARGFAMVVVSIVSLSGGKITDDALHQQLATLGVKRADTHPELGNVASALETLCKQRFIMHELDEEKKKWYILAETALDQLGTETINKFISSYAVAGGGADD